MGAAAAADAPLGNVVRSRAFQFALVPTASWSLGMWTPRRPKTFEPLTNRWIYAFEVGSAKRPHIPQLAAEYHADKDGRLGFVDGAKRRGVDAKAAPKPTSVPEAALPVALQ